MSHRNTLAALLLLAAPLSAQTTASHRMGGAIYSGGPTTAQHRLRKPAGTSGGATSVNPPVSAAAVYDLGNQQEVIWGGVDFDGSTQSMSRGTALPGISGGVPTYPLTVVMWCKPDTTTGNDFLLQIDDGSASNRLCAIRSTTSLLVRSSAGGSSSDATITTVFTAGRWTCLVFVWASDSSRSGYAGTNTTGATETTTRSATGLTTLRVGAETTSASFNWNGEIGPIWILSGDLSGAGATNVAKRAAIYAGYDPVLVTGFPRIEHYPMQAATGASQSGNYDLTPANSPTATSRLLVARDLSGNGRHVRATTAPPTYSASQGNGQGGGAFDSASSQFLVFDGSVPTSAPLQVYAVGQSSSASAAQGAAWLGDKDGTADFWSLFFAGATSGDPLGWRAMRGSAADAVTSAGYSVSTNYVLWALESSATTRAAQINGGSQGTNSTSTSPATADRFGLGGWLDSTPSNFLDGQIHYVILQTTSSTAGKTRIERFLGAAFNVSVP